MITYIDLSSGVRISVSRLWMKFQSLDLFGKAIMDSHICSKNEMITTHKGEKRIVHSLIMKYTSKHMTHNPEKGL